MRRAVASPGGTTARGLAALERGGVRPAFQAAMDAILDDLMAALVFAAVRDQIADFLGALILVYTLCIVGWVVVSLVFSLGVRVPYNRVPSTRSWTSCATSPSRSCGSSGGSGCRSVRSTSAR